MKTVNEIAKLTGISVRTLHYYDEIGLLSPTKTTDSGYRLYDDITLKKLQQILFFKELEFPLKDINLIMNNPNFNPDEALRNHKTMLMMKRDRLNRLIHLVDKTIKGESDMSFKEFDMTEIEKIQKEYAQEAKERWGNTKVYAESKQKISNYSKNDWNRMNKKAEEIFKAFAQNINKEPSSKEVQCLVKAWQDFISENYYHCTNEILAGLGEMYVADERFTKNIDKYAKGLSIFMREAIKIYCNNN